MLFELWHHIKEAWNRRTCVKKGHNWDTYAVSTGYGSNEIEQAGYCLRCKEDTHGQYHDTEA